GRYEVKSAPHTAVSELLQQPTNGLLTVWSTGPTHDHEMVRLAACLAEFGQGFNGRIGAFEGLNPTDEQEKPSVEGKPERPAGLGAMPRSEERVVDPEGDDADASRIGPVQRGDLLGLHR